MTKITFQDGKALLRGNRIGTEKECCCGCAPCPDLESLCISITLTDYNGTVYTADQDDIVWIAGSGYVTLGGFEYSIIISCSVSGETGGIDATVGWGGFIEECGEQCSSAEGSSSIPCSAEADWYVGTISGTFNFGGVCDPGCPQNAGTFSITFSDPPC